MKGYYYYFHDYPSPPPLVLPPDPREWTRDHVGLWLLHAASQYQLGHTHPERFPMNGKALLLMTRDMFLSRVPHGGGLLYEDIQLKLQKVISELYKTASESKDGGKTAGQIKAGPSLFGALWLLRLQPVLSVGLSVILSFDPPPLCLLSSSALKSFDLHFQRLCVRGNVICPCTTFSSTSFPLMSAFKHVKLFIQEFLFMNIFILTFFCTMGILSDKLPTYKFFLLLLLFYTAAKLSHFQCLCQVYSYS